MADPITIKNLPTINEINTGDLLIVQTPTRTGVLKFEDFVVGEEHVSFFKDIQDLVTEVKLLSDDIAPHIDNIQKITAIEQVSNGLTTNLQNIQTNIGEIDAKLTLIEAKVLTVEGTASENAASILALDARITALEAL
jgi:hypothetical protein